MKWRRTTKKDIPAIRELWEQAGYGFDFPDLRSEHLISSWVALEGGKIVLWTGAMQIPEIVAIIDPEWGSPHRRVKLMASLHRPVAEDCRAKGHERAFCNIDPQFCRFWKRLERLGWIKSWETMWITAGRILGAKK